MQRTEFQDGVAEYVLESWTEFPQLVAEKFATAPAYVFRGQSDYDWPLVSSIDRLQKQYPLRKNLGGHIPKFFPSPPLQEEDHLAAFKRAVRGRRGPNPSQLSDDEFWALGQHHGLATPLLDWTRSPYVALFFAFEEELRSNDHNHLTAPAHRGVYAISTSTIADERPGRSKPQEAEPEDSPPVKLLSSVADENHRLISQGGILLKMPRDTHLEDYVRRKFEGEVHRDILVKVKLPNKDRHGCLIALHKMNINRMSLFPDIEGAARFVNSLWQPGHEDSIAYI